jgi:hypothetical protein
MLAKDPGLASRMASNLRRMLDVVGLRGSIAKARLAEIESLFEKSGHGEISGSAGRSKSQDTVHPMRAHAARSSKHP